MAQQKRNPLDTLTKRLRGLLDDLDRLLNPPLRPTPKPARVPVPIPARKPRPNDYR